MTNGSLMKVLEHFANVCNTIDLHKVIIGLENQFPAFLRVAVLYRFYCILLPIKHPSVYDLEIPQSHIADHIEPPRGRDTLH